jgi:thioesterase domain-containing protein
MAQQLEEAGEQVSLLAILDAGLPSTQVDDRPLDEEELQVKLHETVVDHCVKGAVLNADEAKSMATSDLIRLAMQHHKDEARERDLAGVSELTEAHYLGWFRNMVTNRHASMRYRPKPYPGRLTLFRGNNSNRGQDYGWGRWALGGVDVYYTDADHERFVAQPKATALAAQLAACLMSADR